MQRHSPAMQKARQMQDTAMIAGVLSSFKQFERKLDKLADNVRWQGATLAELRAMVSGGVNRPGDMRAVSTQCDVRGRRRQALQPIGHPIHVVNTAPAGTGDMRAVSTECEVRGRRRQALQPIGHPIHVVNTAPGAAGGGPTNHHQHRRAPITLPLPSLPHPKNKHRRRHVSSTRRHPSPTRRHPTPARRHPSPAKRRLITVMPRKTKESKKRTWTK